MVSRGLHVNWDLQANVSLRKSPQEQFKKLVRNNRQKAAGRKHSRLLGAGDPFLKARIIPTCHSSHATNNISPSVKKNAEEKDGSFELEPQLCSSDCSSITTLLPKRQPLPRTTVPRNQGGPGGKTVFKGVTFHLGILQPLDPLVWGKQLGLCQGGSPLWETGQNSCLQGHSSLERKLG